MHILKKARNYELEILHSFRDQKHVGKLHNLINRFNYTNANYRFDRDKFNRKALSKDLINRAKIQLIATKSFVRL